MLMNGEINSGYGIKLIINHLETAMAPIVSVVLLREELQMLTNITFELFVNIYV